MSATDATAGLSTPPALPQDERTKPVPPHIADVLLILHILLIYGRPLSMTLKSRAAIRGFERAVDEDDEPRWLVVLDGIEERLPVSRRQWPTVRDLVAER